MVDLKESARQWVLREMPYDRGNATLVAYLNGLDAHALLVAYHNWISRLVKPQPRTVHKSTAYQQNPLTAQRAKDLGQIIADIEQGKDLRKYLSRDVARNPVRTPGRRRPDLDLMLNDWAVHHLHISSIVEADGFVKRDGRDEPLLFVSFTPDAAYLIDIMMHGDWTRDHVLQVLASEWPDRGVIHEIRAAGLQVIGLAAPIKEDERANLRKNHYNAEFEYGGKVFMAAGGMMGAGTTLVSARQTQLLLRKLSRVEKSLTENPRCFAADFERSGVVFPDAPNFEFAISEDGAGLIETKTRSWRPLTS